METRPASGEPSSGTTTPGEITQQQLLHASSQSPVYCPQSSTGNPTIPEATPASSSTQMKIFFTTSYAQIYSPA